MTNSITRKLHVCFSRLMSCSSSSSVVHNKTRSPDSVSSSPSSSSPTSSPFVFKNFNSLYDNAAASNSDGTPAASNSANLTATTTATATDTAAATDSDDLSTDADFLASSDPDLSSAIASRRLLPPSFPSRSNAIADPSAVPVGICVAVPTYSPDPYGDFRWSMEEMAAAMGLLGHPRGERIRRRRLERLHELLLCYLALNRKHTHKYIVGAFADLLVGLSEEEEPADGGERSGR